MRHGRWIFPLSFLCWASLFFLVLGRPALAAGPAPDLAPGYRFSRILPLPGPSVQAVYDPGMQEWVSMDDNGTLSVIQSQPNHLLAVVQSLIDNNPFDVSPNLVDDPATHTVFWINSTAKTVESIKLMANPADDRIRTVAVDPSSSQFLSVGPRGQTLYLIDPFASTLSWLAIGGGAATTISLPETAYAPAAVYAAGNRVALFIPSTQNVAHPGEGSVMRVLVDPVANRAGPVATLTDPRLPTSLAVSSTTGTLFIAAGSPLNAASTLTAVPDAVYAAAIPNDAKIAPAGLSIAQNPGDLAVDTAGQAVMLDTPSAGATTVMMTYDPAGGGFRSFGQAPAQGPLATSAGIVTTPGGGAVLTTVLGTSPDAESVAGLLPSPLSAAQMAVSPDTGALLVPNAAGAALLDPTTGAVTAQLTVPKPSGGVAFAGSHPIVGSSSGAIYQFGPSGSLDTVSATYQSLAPTQLAVSAGQTGMLLSGGWFQAGTHPAQTAPAGAANLLGSASGWAAVGANRVSFFQPDGTPGAVLSDSRFAGPTAWTPDGGYLLAQDGYHSGLTLVDTESPTLLGTLPLTLPAALTPPVMALSTSPDGHWLYLLTPAAVGVFQGPQLTLQANPSGSSPGTVITVTATLKDSGGHPVAGQSVRFSTGQTAKTDLAGEAQITLVAPSVASLTVTATAPGVRAQITLAFTTPANPPPPPSEPAGGGAGGGTQAPGGWVITAALPPGVQSGRYPTLSVIRGVPLPKVLPPGTVEVAFRVKASHFGPYFPRSYRLTVKAPSGFQKPFSVWYYSRGFGRWFPLEPKGLKTGTFWADEPFLIQFAITDVPVPPRFPVLAKSRVDLADQLAPMAFPAGAGTVLLANRGYGTAAPVDALAASGLAARLHAPLLLSPRNRLPKTLLATLRRLDAHTVEIVGGPRAISPAIRKTLAANGYRVLAPFGGRDRFQTALLISQFLNAQSGGQSPVYLADGAHVAEAGTLAATVAAHQAMVLLTLGKNTPPDVLAWLYRHPAQRVVAVERPRYLPPDVLTKLDRRGAVSRISTASTAALALQLWREEPAWGGWGIVSDAAKGPVGRAAAIVGAELSQLYSVPLLYAAPTSGRPALPLWRILLE